MNNSKKQKLLILFGILVVFGLVEIFAERALHARKQTTNILSIFPSWVTFAVLGATALGYYFLWMRPRPSRPQALDQASIFNQKAPVKLVLLSLCVWLIGSYVFGALLDIFDKSSYPPLSNSSIVGVLALIPAVVFFRYFSARKKAK